MLDACQILVSDRACRLVLAIGVVVALSGCGQKGRLYLPSGEAASSRATLPQILVPTASTPPVTGTGTANPIPTP